MKEKNKEQLHKIELLESDAVELNHQRNAKLKITELEQKLSLEQTNKYRLEHQAERMKDTVHKLYQFSAGSTMGGRWPHILRNGNKRWHINSTRTCPHKNESITSSISSAVNSLLCCF